MSIASNFRDKWDVLIKASDDTFHSFVPDTRRAAMARAADAADLILTEKRAFQALANRIRELEEALSAERARVIERCAKWHDAQARGYSVGTAEERLHRRSAAALRALGQQDTGGADHE